MELQLTKAEEQIMAVVWDKGKATIRSVTESLTDTNPHYNTVSTLLKILEEKGFVQTEKVGNVLVYAPLFEKERYSKQRTKKLVNQYFDGSIAKLLTFFVKEKDISLKELDQIIQQLKSKK